MRRKGSRDETIEAIDTLERLRHFKFCGSWGDGIYIITTIQFFFRILGLGSLGYNLSGVGRVFK